MSGVAETQLSSHADTNTVNTFNIPQRKKNDLRKFLSEIRSS